MSKNSTTSRGNALVSVKSLYRQVISFLSRTPVLVIASGLITTVVMAYALRIWRADLFIPFSTDGESLYWQTLVQNFLETGSFFTSHRLDILGGNSFYGLPGSDAIHYLLLAILALISRNPGATVNLFYLLTFPLSTMSAVYVLRKLDATPIVSSFCGILYAFLPYHFWRGTADPLLSAYYMVPLSVLLILKIQDGSTAIRLHGEALGFIARIRENMPILRCILLAILVTSTGLDYGYFFLLLAGVALGYRILSDRRWSSQATGGVIVIAAGWITILANRLPLLIAQWSGRILYTPEKAVSDAETYSLKFIDLIIPNAHHQLGRFRNMVEVFHRAEPLLNENISTALGILGAAGIFAALAAPILLWHADTKEKKLLVRISVLVYAALMISTLGGFGSFLYRYLYDGVSQFYRMVVFLSFFALAALALVIDATLFAKGFSAPKPGSHAFAPASNRLLAPLINAAKRLLIFWRRMRAKLVILLIPLLFLGLFDTVPVNSAFPYAANRQEQAVFVEFFAKAEASVPENTKVFVLPAATFPATDFLAGTDPYAHAIPYLNTWTLQFSYGAIPSSSADERQRELAALPAGELLDNLRAQGYGAIYVDLLVARDDALKGKTDELLALVEEDAVVSADGLYIFLPI